MMQKCEISHLFHQGSLFCSSKCNIQTTDFRLLLLFNHSILLFAFLSDLPNKHAVPFKAQNSLLCFAFMQHNSFLLNLVQVVRGEPNLSKKSFFCFSDSQFFVFIVLWFLTVSRIPSLSLTDDCSLSKCNQSSLTS